MNTGPIIGGTRDAEQFSRPDTRAFIPAHRPLAVRAFNRETLPTIHMDEETLRFVPFHFYIRGYETRTGFWVSLCDETRNMVDDAEFRIYILMKLSERYKESLEDHYQRERQDHANGRCGR